VNIESAILKSIGSAADGDRSATALTKESCSQTGLGRCGDWFGEIVQLAQVFSGGAMQLARFVRPQLIGPHDSKFRRCGRVLENQLW
jgi:hypothetical protein